MWCSACLQVRWCPCQIILQCVQLAGLLSAGCVRPFVVVFLLVRGCSAAVIVRDFILKSIPFMLSSLIGLTLWLSQTTERPVDNDDINAIIISPAWLVGWCLYTWILGLKLCYLSPLQTAVNTDYSIIMNHGDGETSWASAKPPFLYMHTNTVGGSFTVECNPLKILHCTVGSHPAEETAPTYAFPARWARSRTQRGRVLNRLGGKPVTSSRLFQVSV